MVFRKANKIHLAWYGMNGSTGYATSGKRLVDWMAKKGIHVHDIANDALAMDCAVGVAYSALCEETLECLPSPYRILYTMFEANRWPAEWVSTANCANQVWVPSRFCKESLVDSGCESPVEIVPLGVDTDVFYPTDRQVSDVFVFGYAGAATHRKGFDLLIRAFAEEFKDENVRLDIASSSMLSATVPKSQHIRTVNRWQSDDEMRAFYGSLDCFIMPSRGEGFGLTPLEAMACGTCVAVTDWGGMREYLGDDCLRIGIDGLESVDGYNGSPGQWAKPSLESIKYCMRYAYENRDTIRDMGNTAAKRVAKGWSLSRPVGRIKKLLATIDPTETVEVDYREVVVWRGNPRSVVTKIGRFVRGVPRELSPAQSALIDFSDGRFQKERRFHRVR